MGVVACVWECEDLPFLLVMFVRALLVVGLCCPSKLLGRTTQMGQLNREAGLSIVDSNIHKTRSKRQADQLTQLLGAAGLSIVDSNIHKTRSKRQADQLTQLLGAAGNVLNALVQGG